MCSSKLIRELPKGSLKRSCPMDGTGAQTDLNILCLLFNIHLFIWLCQVLVVACRVFDLCCGMWGLQSQHVNS